MYAIDKGIDELPRETRKCIGHSIAFKLVKETPLQLQVGPRDRDFTR